MTREHLYVAMTRGRGANHAYVPLDRHDDLDEAHHHVSAARGPVTGREVLEQILATTGAEQSATEQLAPLPMPRQPVSARRPQDRDRSLAASHGPGRDGPGLTR
jgi:hypothetical protein